MGDVTDGASPEMSVILTTPDSYETIRGTVRKLREQTVADRLELIFVAPSSEELQLVEPDLEGFRSFQVVEAGTVRSVAAGNAAGVRAANAPIVAFAEDHSYPAPDWAAALIAAHRKPWAAVGPIIVNANPETAVSRADYLLGFGPWIEGVPGGVVDYLPGHNSSYKRDVLLPFGPELEGMLRAECLLHWELQKRGHQLYLEPAAKTFHFNFARLSSASVAMFFHGRTFGGERARTGGWGPGRRLAYVAAGPLIPVVRLRRAMRDLGRSGRRDEMLNAALPATILNLAVSALGEMMGYAFGPGKAPERVSRFEFHRDRHVTSRDRAAMANFSPGSPGAAD